MKYSIIKIDEKPSRWGGRFFYVFFKGEDGKQYYTCLYPKCRNFPRWKKVMKEGIVLDNLNVKDKAKRLIDADSFPRKVMQ